MVGSLDPKSQEMYADILVKYFDDPKTIFVISSDFCHWGARFKYQYYKKEDGEIFQSIEKNDRNGMKFIESHDANGFTQYINETKNTICGRNPISILLRILEKSKLKESLKSKFVGYSQSGQVKDINDSSVSYASAITYLPL